MTVTLAFILVIIGIFIGINIAPGNNFGPIPFQVVEKYETRDGRCYIQTWVEVTPEEYIGLEVGDEFEVRK